MSTSKKLNKIVIKRPGALTKKAKAAGMSIDTYCGQFNLPVQ